MTSITAAILSVLLTLLISICSVKATGAIHDPGRSRTTAELIELTKSPRNKAGEFDPAFDCAWRVYALKYTTEIQPWLTPKQLSAINDALSIVSLNCSNNEHEKILNDYKPKIVTSTFLSSTLQSTALSIYVDYINGNDANNGNIASPLKTISSAVQLARVQRGSSGSTNPVSIVLRGGTHVLNVTIELTPQDSFTTFVAYPGEVPVVTGAQPLPKLVWSPFNVTNSTKPTWGPVLNNTNAVYGQCPNADVPDKGVMKSWQDCQASCQADKTCTAWTYHTPLCTGCSGFIGHCCWHLDDQFPTVTEVGVVSQQLVGASNKNIWVADLASLPSGSQPSMTALHINGHRATLARFPNANPEFDIFPKGYIMDANWLPPLPGPVWNETLTIDLRPLGLADMGAGVYINYTVGIGGNAARYANSRSFWASRDFGPQSYQPTATCDRWEEMHLRSPSGLDTSTSLVNSPYANISQLIVRTWRESHWYSWMFPVGEQIGSKFIFNGGGFQGGEGCDNAAEYFVQGVLEELDAVNEYFYDSSSGKLYFFPNITDQNSDGSPNVALAEVPTLAVLFNLYGSEEYPVANVTFNGLTFTGGRPTFLDPHDQPSGGDWALERLGAVLIEGATNIEISDCLFTRIDGNAIYLGGYSRGVQILRNEFSLLGNNAIASWGKSVDYDGTGGQQPRRGLIYGNVAHDIGLEQKQSSFYFTAQSCENSIVGNIVYNIPRAAINFEDNFGGATLVQDNLLFNTCRESSDHSSINSWSRMPYVTMVRDGVTPSAIPAYTNFTRNFIVNNYAADGGCVDTDDGSNNFIMNDNACMFGGTKSDFDGHSTHSFNNLHLYSSIYGDRCLAIMAQILPLPSFGSSYVNNTCVLVPNAQCIDMGQSSNNFPSVDEFKQRVIFGNNTIYNTLGDACSAAGGVWKSFKDFQDGGWESGAPSTVISTLPSAETMIGWVKEKLEAPVSRMEKAVSRNRKVCTSYSSLGPILTSSPASATARLGQDHAVSSNGRILVVVAGGYFSPATTNPTLAAGVRGMVYVYKRNSDTPSTEWILLEKLVPSDVDSPNQNLVLASSGATAVAVSRDGEVIVVGAIGSQVNMSNVFRGYGAAYTWVRNSQTQKYEAFKRVVHPSCLIKGINVLPVNPNFGRSVAMDDDGMTLAVSSYLSTNIFTIFRKVTGSVAAGGSFWEYLPNERVIAEGYAADAKVLIRTRMAMSGDGARVFISHYIGEVNGKVDAYQIGPKGTAPAYISTMRPIGNARNVAACNFGLAISSSSDGNRVIVSAPFYNGLYQLSGATFVFDYDSVSKVYLNKAILGNSPETVRPNSDCGWPIQISHDGKRIALACTSAPVSPGSRITTGGVAVYVLNNNSGVNFDEKFWITANDLPLGVAYFPTSIGCLSQDCRQLSLGIDAWRSDFPEQGAVYFWSEDSGHPAYLPPGKKDEALVFGTPLLIDKSQVLPPANGASGADEAGYDVSVSDDGSVVCVVENGRVPTGAITVYINRVFFTRLTLPDSFASQPLAAGTYVSGNGQVIVAISNPISNALENLVYTWTRRGSVFELDAVTLSVKPPAGAQAALFFNALAISRDANTLVATWTYTTVTGGYSAQVTVFKRENNNKWTFLEDLKLTTADTSFTNRDWIGQGGVAISADALVIAAATDGGGRPGLSPGDAGYVATFKRKTLSDPFVFEAVMTSAVRSDSAYLFWPLALSGDGKTIAGYLNDNSFPGRVIIWVRDANNKWPNEPSKVLNLTDLSQNTEDDSFGSSLSLSDDGTRLLVGSYLASIYGTLSGIAVFYSRPAAAASASNWTVDFMLYPSEGTDGTSFGSGVALTGSGTHAYIGAPGGGEKGEGVVYVWDPPGAPNAAPVPIVVIAVSAAVVAVAVSAVILLCIFLCGRKVQADRQKKQMLRKTLGTAQPEHLSIRNVGTFHEVDEF